MSRISIATVFIEEIEKQFRNHLPPSAVKILILMAEQMMQMEAAMNAQQEMITKLMKFAVLSKEYEKALQQDQKKFDRQFGEQLAMSEKIGED